MTRIIFRTEYILYTFLSDLSWHFKFRHSVKTNVSTHFQITSKFSIQYQYILSKITVHPQYNTSTFSIQYQYFFNEIPVNSHCNNGTFSIQYHWIFYTILEESQYNTSTFLIQYQYILNTIQLNHLFVLYKFSEYSK